MAELGIHGLGDRPDGVGRMDHLRVVLGQLPPIFSTVWRSDHLQHRGEPLPEVWTELTWIAATFPHLRVGTMVMSQSYRNPALLGAMAATLQELSGGRLILGLGAGWLEEEYRAFDYDYPSGGTRVAQLGEAIQVMRALWTGRPASFDGHWYHLADAVGVRPDPPIPILVGTNGPKALGIAARHADWWVWDGPWDVSYRAPYERLRAECDAIGRPFEEMTLVAELSVALPDDPSTFVATSGHEFYPGQVFGMAGPTAADVIREIELLVDHGVQHVAINFEDIAQLRRFVDEVVPHVRLEPRP